MSFGRFFAAIHFGSFSTVSTLCGHSALKAVWRDLKQSRFSDALPAILAFNSLSFPNLVTIETSGGATS